MIDDGNHTFLTAELMPIHSPKSVILPTDFNCMGYAVPAAIGAKLAHPERVVQAIVGDGAFLMTCMEILTAATNDLGVVYYVFNDGELAQIAQAQQSRTTASPARGSESSISKAWRSPPARPTCRCPTMRRSPTSFGKRTRSLAGGWPVIVDVRIDYSKRTAFTEGTMKTNFRRFPFNEKLRFLTRAAVRHVAG